MNYLAHIFLAENHPESIIGNLLGDFVKGRLEKYQNLYSDRVIQGIGNHRQIDYFTDHHRVFLDSKRRISSQQRRFAGIIVDICYDHFLARNWSSFASEKLESFSQRIYKILQQNLSILPEKLQQAVPRMIAEDWLTSYRDYQGICLTFTRLSRRVKFTNHLSEAATELMNNYTELESDFFQFFPELIGYVQQNRLNY